MPLDVVIFGVIAVILIFRFLGVLGQNDKNDGRPRKDSFGAYRKHIEERRAQRKASSASLRNARSNDKQGSATSSTGAKVEQKVTQLPLKAKQQEAKGEIQAAARSNDSADTIRDKAFTEGAKSAFAMILEAYSNGDEARLASLLDKEKMLPTMVAAIAEREKKGHRLAISLHEIISSKIIERSSNNEFENITVEFVSKQCHLEFDKDNKLVDGDPDVEETLTDLWTFRQALVSDDPTWFLCETRSKRDSKAAKTSGQARKKKQIKQESKKT